MSKVYERDDCPLCGKRVSRHGLAQTAHKRKHCTEGLMYEYRDPSDPYGYCCFALTAMGKERARVMWEAGQAGRAKKGAEE